MIVDKNFFQWDKTKFIFENLFFSQRAFVSWWNVHLNVSDCLNPFMSSGNKRLYILNLQFLDAGLFKYIWSFVPPGTKGLRILNICETKSYENKSCKFCHKNESIVTKLWMSRFLLHLLIYLWTLYYFGIKSNKIEHILKPNPSQE